MWKLLIKVGIWIFNIKKKSTYRKILKNLKRYIHGDENESRSGFHFFLHGSFSFLGLP